MRPSFMEQVENRAHERSHLSLPTQVGKLSCECHVLLGHASLKSTFPGLCPSRYWMKGVAPQVSIVSTMSFQVSGREAGSLPNVFHTALLQCCPEPFDHPHLSHTVHLGCHPLGPSTHALPYSESCNPALFSTLPPPGGDHSTVATQENQALKKYTCWGLPWWSSGKELQGMWVQSLVTERRMKIPPCQGALCATIRESQGASRPSQNQINQLIKVSAGHQVETSSMIQSFLFFVFNTQACLLHPESLVGYLGAACAKQGPCVRGQACCESTHGHQGLMS